MSWIGLEYRRLDGAAWLGIKLMRSTQAGRREIDRAEKSDLQKFRGWLRAARSHRNNRRGHFPYRIAKARLASSWCMWMLFFPGLCCRSGLCPAMITLGLSLYPPPTSPSPSLSLLSMSRAVSVEFVAADCRTSTARRRDLSTADGSCAQ